MSSFKSMFTRLFFTILSILTVLAGPQSLLAQCSALSGPVYSNTCSTDFFTAVSASGTGVTSTITFTGSSCAGTYFNYYTTQGVNAPTGNTVNMPVNRCLSTYVGYVSIYIDWNNDNTYQTSELAAGPYTYAAGVTTHTFSFAVPTTSIVTGSHLHMRVMLSELTTGAPCTASYGETLDFYFQANCSSLPSISVSPSSATICSGGGGATLTASGAGIGGTYSWTPSTGLSATTGATIVATPGSTTTYTITGRTSIGCTNTSTVMVSVNPTPASISGSSSVCEGAQITLSDGTAGGTWSSSSTNATVGSSSGIVTGVTAGTVTISYTVAGCSATKIITVNPTPGSILGTLSVCIGASNTLSNALTGGTWTASNANVNIGSASGIVTGVTAGTSTITYTLSTGCFATAVVTVNSLPAAIAGTFTVCPGTTTALTDATTGGTWSSSNTNANIGSSSGIVTGVTAGTSTITYTSSLGCIATAVVTINPLPSAISGSLNVCLGSSVTLTDITPGGTWSASNTNISIGSLSGLVTGSTLGTSIVTYTISTGCYITAVETVNPLPAAISGASVVCVGATIALTDVTSGGSWSSGSTNASVGSTSGIVTGVTSGNAVITYMLGTGCFATKPITVNPAPANILGASGVCVGSSILLLDATSGGTWSGSNGNASVGSTTGIVTGVLAGTLTVTYTLTATGCYTVFPLTVNPLPATIGGTLSVCIGLTTTLTDATTGGTWSLSNSNASVGSTLGVVTGVTAGTDIVTYTLSTGCITTAVVTINGLPASISGASNVCVGSTTPFNDITSGGVWSSSNTNASVGSSSGIVTGNAAGISVISYTLSTGCYAVKTITIDAIPLPITGPNHVCVGSTITLSDATAGGTWTSSNTAIATIGSSSGIVVGITASPVVICTYMVGTGCYVTMPVTVDPLPASISGVSHLCVGSVSSLSNATSGGTWSSSTSNATIGSLSGVLTGVSAGVTTISYTLSTGCYSLKPVTIDPLPASITGPFRVCVGSMTLLTDATSSGTWTAGNSNALIGSASGIVTGVFAGTTPITYSLSTGCIATAIVTVDPLPALIGGTLHVCEGLTTLLTDASSGGTWSASNSNATVGSTSGLVTGVNAGTTVITYTLSTGCITTTTVTIDPLPSAITGATNVCVGSTTLMTDITTPGTWTSSNAHCTVGSTSGLVTGVSAGPSVITYTLPTGCIATYSITVDPLPSAIAGTFNACPGFSILLSDVTGGGAWSSSNTNVTIGSGSGLVTGMLTGTSVITYTLPTGCYITANFSVNTVPAPIGGTTVVCVGSSGFLTDATSGGVWSISNANATVGSASGIINGVSSGTAIVTYTSSNGCYATASVTINGLPVSITGGNQVCVGATITCIDPGGGLWSSSNANITIGSLSGIVTGITAGTSDITYTLGTGCTVTETITINPLPAAITGLSHVCEGSSIILSDLSAGGVWSSGSSNVSVGTGSGVVNGITAGTALITYTLPTGCTAFSTITIDPVPAGITGPLSVCVGSGVLVTSLPLGGTWSVSNANTNVGSATGIVTGVSTGTSVITYTIPTGCQTTRLISVNPLPGPVSGFSTVCVGQTITLTDAGGGTWLSSNTLVAAVGSTSGIVTGIAAGPATITYTLPTGCFTVFNISVNPLPSAITGSTSICLANTSLLSDVGGGTWSSSNTAVATIGSSSGLVTALAIGSSVITYTIATGCYITTTVNVISLPAPISGPATVCEGSSITLIDAGGGTWISSNPAVASVGSLSGVVNGIIAGSTTITYMLGTGCQVTKAITVNPLPPAITGSGNICIGSTGTLTDSGPGGSWSSGSPLITSVGSGSGLVNGLALGTSNITYTISTGCYTIRQVTVNPLPPAITGTFVFCPGATSLLADASLGGTWNSGNIAIATIGTSTGLANGIAAGSASITYTSVVGCKISTTVTVNPAPNAITGTLNICTGSTSASASSSPGGVWSSSNTSVATVGSSTGIVTGISAGTASISYTLPTGCFAVKVVTINPLPFSISGPSTVCVGSVIGLSNPASGGVWSSSLPAIASIGSSTGIVTGVAVGTSNITYTLPSGCRVNTDVTVQPLPLPIVGPSQVCMGSTIVLASATTGGVWSSTATSLVNVGSATGIIDGISTGTAIISYANPVTGCTTVKPVVVNPVSPVLGVSSVCVGSTAVYTDTVLGGVWSTSATAIGSISTGGLFTGVASGTVTISYITAGGCLSVKSVTVYPVPPAIVGPHSVCEASSISLSNPMPGGTWSSSNPSIGTVDPASGVVLGITAGIFQVNYSVSGCAATHIISVNPLPAPITGILNVCAGSTTLLGSTTAGGGWTSSTSTVATIGSASGLLSGLSAGTSNITYSLSTGCVTNTSATVNPLPNAIAGLGFVCVGSTITLSTTSVGGTWTSSAPSIASIDLFSGDVTGITAGVATISYTTGAGCYRTRAVTVNALPAPIFGPGQVCAGSTILLTDISTGGVWSVATIGVAGIGSSSGIVSGIAAGTALISYTLSSTGCSVDKMITVNPLPSAITGTSILCAGLTTVFSDATVGGAWSSSDTLIASVGSATGTITGVAAGNVVITYTLPTGCLASKALTVIPVPGAITGPAYVCLHDSITLHNATPTGKWYSASPAIAAIDSVSGMVIGNGVGAAMITYTLGFGCTVARLVTVMPLPSVFSVTGGGSYCFGGSGVLVGLSGSVTGTNYFLYNGATPSGSFTGTGSPLNMGLQSVAGTYTVTAVTTATGCKNNMAGSAIVNVIPTVIPAVSVNATPAGAVCAGTSVTFNQTTLNGGSAPSYQWSVNGVSVSIGSSYVFIPANGDVVTVRMTSNANCASPVSVTASITEVVNPYASPSVSIDATPGAHLCKGEPVTITATEHFGGTAPVYSWIKNGVPISAVGSYTFVPDNNDQIYCILSSNYPCRLTNVDTSATLVISVDTPVAPIVTITADPGTSISKGQTLTLTANVVNGGTDPSYQWLINGLPIAGATNATYTNNNFSYPLADSVTCAVTSSNICKVTSFKWVYINVVTVGVASTFNQHDWRVYPNPSNGSFSIRLPSILDANAIISITSLLGEQVYTEEVLILNGVLNHNVKLDNSIANGNYILNLKSNTQNINLPIVLER